MCALVFLLFYHPIKVFGYKTKKYRAIFCLIYLQKKILSCYLRFIKLYLLQFKIKSFQNFLTCNKFFNNKFLRPYHTLESCFSEQHRFSHFNLCIFSILLLLTTNRRTRPPQANTNTHAPSPSQSIENLPVYTLSRSSNSPEIFLHNIPPPQSRTTCFPFGH